MRSLFAAALLILAAGCAGDPCDVEGASRCMGDAAETCTNGTWEVSDDCAATGASCMQMETMAEGEAHCM